MENWTVIGPIVGVIVTTIGGYFLARRKSSGVVRTTDADKLWDVLVARLDAATIRYDEVVRALAAGNTAHDAVVAQLRAELVECATECRRLSRQLQKVRAQ